MANTFGIDVHNTDKKVLIRRLSRLKSTESATDGGIYNWCPDISQVIVETTKTEEQLDHWLWATKGVGYVGIFAV